VFVRGLAAVRECIRSRKHEGQSYDFSWHFEKSHGGYNMRNAMGGAPYPTVIGYDAGGKNPRQVLVYDNDARVQIWYIHAA
jgi:hypothetical protein